MSSVSGIVGVALLLLPVYLMLLSGAIYIGRTISAYGMVQWVLNQNKKKKERDKNG
jgi:hypothetical protein